MGVLAVDFRNLQDTAPEGFDGSNADVVQALAWLKAAGDARWQRFEPFGFGSSKEAQHNHMSQTCARAAGASELYLVGDSSGATQVVQNLMHLRSLPVGAPPPEPGSVAAVAAAANVTIQGAVRPPGAAACELGSVVGRFYGAGGGRLASRRGWT
jgi:hypothetical protein